MASTPSSLESKKPDRLREPARMSFASARGKVWSRTRLMRLPNVLVSDTFLAVARWLAVKSSVTYIISKVGDGRPTLFRQQPAARAGCKGWLNEGDAIVGEFFERLGVAKDELVEICTGYVLEGPGRGWRQAATIGGKPKSLVRSRSWPKQPC